MGSIKLETLTVKAKGTNWVGVAYCCPNCDVAISLAIDPVALKADTVGEVLRRLGKG
jgi:hypothetical protein